MKVIIYLAVAVCALHVVPKLADAGPTSTRSGRVGNGGFAYVCRDKAGTITEARLLDLWEAEGVPTWRKDDSIDIQIEAAIARLKGYSPNSVFDVLDNIAELRATATYTNRALTPTEDAFPPYQPAGGCGYEQVARFEPVVSETGKSGLRIASEIYHSPLYSNTDRAALFVHEAIYLSDRELNQAKNSQRTRIVVAHLFSDSRIPNAIRLATASLMIGEKIWEDVLDPKERVRRNIVAVPNPDAIPFELQFSSVDGIDSFSIESMTAAQRAASYRCVSNVALQLGETTEAETGWRSLADLVKEPAMPRDSESEVVRIRGIFRAHSFDTLMEWGAPVQNSIAVRCERRDPEGVIETVAFREAVFTFPVSESLYIRDDGSITTSPGQYPLAPIDSRPMSTRKAHSGEFFLEIVRGIF